MAASVIASIIALIIPLMIRVAWDLEAGKSFKRKGIQALDGSF